MDHYLKSASGVNYSKKSIVDYLQQSRAMLEEAFDNNAAGEFLNGLVTEQYDRLIKALFIENRPISIKAALVALGGYGRKEMSPYSDVDIMLLHEDKADKGSEELIKIITYPLWDGGVEVSGVVRTIDDCIKVAVKDVKSLTSMMDARFITGDEYLFREFRYRLSEHISKPSVKKRFIRDKVDEYRKRLERYGDSVFVSEPHVKEGEGGLRCYHTSLWLSKVRDGIQTLDDLNARNLLSIENLKSYREALDFLWKIRHGLHLLAKRRQDRLSYENQEALATRLGFDNGNRIDALENIMHNFYRQASCIHMISEMLVDASVNRGFIKKFRDKIVSKKLEENIYRIGDKIHISARADLKSDPALAMKACNHAHKLKIRIDAKSKSAIKNASFRWSGDLSETCKEAVEIFRQIISDPVKLDKVLIDLHETQVLEKLIPEFSRLNYKVQYDAYHLYTVDVHTLFLIRELSRLAKAADSKDKNEFLKAFREIERFDILAMAGLLHDIGKGIKGPERHDQSGARIAKQVMERFGYSDEEQELVEFLVRSHLILPQVAFCRDTADTAMIENLANAVKTSDALRMLYVLTYADIRATGTDVWTTWKGELLTNLYLKTSDFLSGKGLTKKNFGEVIAKKLKEISSYVDKNEIEEIESWLKEMPVRYIFTTPASKMAAHFISKSTLENDVLKMISIPGEPGQYHDLTIVTKDASGLFAKICEVLAGHNISILEAQLNTDKKGCVVDIFKVVSSSGRKIRDDFNWDRLSGNLKSAVAEIENKMPCKTQIRQSESGGTIRRRRFGHKTKVLLDNDVSAYYSVLEIHAPDQIGLLYKIANWLYSNGYDIFTAKVTTHVGQAIDVFYIKKIDGKKVESKEEGQNIKKELFDLLSN